jgi:ElaB/YqjD/DUF883 family membrane-anchored ribosome-binding protein
MDNPKDQVDRAKQRIETMGASARDSLEDLKQSAGDAAHRATRYVQDRLERADDRLADVTGQPLASWTADVKDYIRDHPVQAALIAVGVGYLLGKLIARG